MCTQINHPPHCVRKEQSKQTLMNSEHLTSTHTHSHPVNWFSRSNVTHSFPMGPTWRSNQGVVPPLDTHSSNLHTPPTVQYASPFELLASNYVCIWINGAYLHSTRLPCQYSHVQGCIGWTWWPSELLFPRLRERESETKRMCSFHGT